MFPLTEVEKSRLATCEEDIQKVVNEVTKKWNINIIFGIRAKEDQDKAFAEGKTKLQWPNSKHNSNPSKAIDMCPVEVVGKRESIDWKDRERFSLFAGYVLGIAEAMGVSIRWGGDWDQDTEVKDNGFDDLVHFELN